MQYWRFALRPIHIAVTELNRTHLLENNELPVQFSSVPTMRTGFHVSRQCHKQGLHRRQTLMTLRIALPACLGRWRLSWQMNTNFRQWGIWARRLVDREKNENFTYPRCIWHFHWKWYNSNINKTFGIRKLDSVLSMILWLAILIQ